MLWVSIINRLALIEICTATYFIRCAKKALTLSFWHCQIVQNNYYLLRLTSPTSVIYFLIDLQPTYNWCARKKDEVDSFIFLFSYLLLFIWIYLEILNTIKSIIIRHTSISLY